MNLVIIGGVFFLCTGNTGLGVALIVLGLVIGD